MMLCVRGLAPEGVRSAAPTANFIGTTTVAGPSSSGSYKSARLGAALVW